MNAPFQNTTCITNKKINNVAPTFYVVSKDKLIIMSFLTFGYYFIYWNYKNWKTYRTATGERIWPVARTIFGLFFIYSLYIKIDRRLRIANRHYNWHPYLLILCALLNVGVNTYVVLVATEPKVFFPIGLASLAFGTYCQLRVQAAINHLEQDPEGRQNTKITLANFAWIALSCVIWFFCISGTLLVP
jgi:hypothetical protein